MQYLTEKLFRREMLKITLIFSTVCQLFCGILKYIYSYIESTGSAEGSLLPDIISVLYRIIGNGSVFAVYGIIVYIVFLYGIRGGGEWLIAILAGYGVSYILTSYLSDMIFGIAVAFVLSAVFITVFICWSKGMKDILSIAAFSQIITYIFGMIILLTASGSGITAYEIEASVLYSLFDLSLTTMLLIVAMRISGAFRAFAMKKNGGVIDIAINGSILPRKNPLLRAYLTIDILYVAISTVRSIGTTFEEIKEYGMPINAYEWLITLAPYIEAVVYFVIGYAVMYAVGNLIENKYSMSVDKADMLAKKQ